VTAGTPACTCTSLGSWHELDVRTFAGPTGLRQHIDAPLTVHPDLTGEAQLTGEVDLTGER